MATIRIKSTSSENGGLYQCVARNVLGEDIAKTRLTGIKKEPLLSVVH